jgi:hypothetical protein
MKYVTDNMLNGLAKILTKAGFDCTTATRAIRKDDDSSKEIPDGVIFRFLLEKKYKLVPVEGAEEYAIITSDKELPKYCAAFDIDCVYEDEPKSSTEFNEMGVRLVSQLKL